MQKMFATDSEYERRQIRRDKSDATNQTRFIASLQQNSSVAFFLQIGITL